MSDIWIVLLYGFASHCTYAQQCCSTAFLTTKQRACSADYLDGHKPIVIVSHHLFSFI
jgi:hypothetical protein